MNRRGLGKRGVEESCRMGRKGVRGRRGGGRRGVGGVVGEEEV